MSSWVTKMLSLLDKMLSFFSLFWTVWIDLHNGVVTMMVFVLQRSSQGNFR